MSAPRLSVTLRGPRIWGYCQGCAAHRPGGRDGLPGLTLWQEAGVEDDTDVAFLWLCLDCSQKHVPNAGRLYVREHSFAPFAGVQRFCVDCAHCENMSCQHELARHGTIVIPGPSSRSFESSYAPAAVTGRVGWVATQYYESAKGCRGFEEAAVDL